FSYFLLYAAARYRDLHSFPTRRSSDLRFTPMNDDVRREVQKAKGFDPIELFQHGTPDAAHLRTFLDFRAELSRKSRNVRRCAASDRKSTRLNSSHVEISYAVFCLKKKK